MEKHTAVYIRVSTAQQNTASQEDELRRWAESKDEPIKWYTDKASGKSMDRAGWKRLWDDVLAGKVSAVVCWRLDRLGRTASGLTKLFEDLQARHVNLISLRDSIDLSTPSGRLLANMLASVAAFETELRGERVRAGIDAAKRRGQKWGGSKRGWHYRVTPEHTKYVVRARREGISVAEMCRVTGLSKPTIYRILRNAGAMSMKRAAGD